MSSPLFLQNSQITWGDQTFNLKAEINSSTFPFCLSLAPLNFISQAWIWCFAAPAGWHGPCWAPSLHAEVVSLAFWRGLTGYEGLAMPFTVFHTLPARGIRFCQPELLGEWSEAGGSGRTEI